MAEGRQPINHLDSKNFHREFAMDEVEKSLYKRLQRLLERSASHPERRILIALAGTPGSGKSTIASALVRSFNATNKEKIQVIPMVC